MKMNTFMRRSGALLTTAGVAAALTMLTPVAADAAVHAQFAARGSANVDYTGPTVGGSCDLTSAPGSDDIETSIASFTHGTRHKAVNMDATFASSDNAADTVRVRGHVSADFTVKRKHKDLTSFDLGVGGSVKITHSVSGSHCSGSGVVLGEMAIQFTEHHKGYFYLTRDTKKPGSVSAFAMINAQTGKLVTLDVFEGSKSHQTSRALLKPGKYVVEIAEAGIQAGPGGIILKSAQGLSAKVARTIHLQGEFKRKH
jgi:hypothetical protein